MVCEFIVVKLLKNREYCFVKLSTALSVFAAMVKTSRKLYT